MIQKAFVYRLWPTDDQANQFAQHFGTARFVYNTALEMKRRYYDRVGKGLSKRSVQDQFVALKNTPEFSWLYNINSQSILAALDHVHNAYKNFFEGRAQYPKYKSRKCHWQSFQCPQHVEMDFDHQCVKLPKIGWVKARLHRSFEGKIKTCTIKRLPSGEHRISILVETPDSIPDKTPVETATTVGIDLGLTHFYTASTGEKVDNPKNLQAALSRLNQLQKRFSRQKKGSVQREKQRLAIAKHHQRITQKRNDFLHKHAYRLVNENQVGTLATEDLHVKGLIRNRKLSRHIADVAWGRFIQFVDYKSDWAGKHRIECGRFQPSSKLCPCGSINRSLTLSHRQWTCANCGTHHPDRDHLAACNIKEMALARYSSGKVLSVA